MKRREKCPTCGELSVNTADPIGVPTLLKCPNDHHWHQPRGT